MIRDRNETVLKEILERDAHNAKTDPDPNVRKLGALYGSCMDEAAIDKLGPKALAPGLGKIAAVTHAASLARETARLHTIGVDAIFEFTSAQDLRDATEVIGVMSQGGLGLPDRDDYLADRARGVTAEKPRAIAGNYVRNFQTAIVGGPAKLDPKAVVVE